ncbi:MAG: hypothetical protein SFY67_06995 [Candidatus Melainabacteria bacterium]|nr:hypothetical protein [Candidatus Melainabacteria bacterium]
MKENLGLFMIAAIISSSCTYVARTMNNDQNAEIQTQNSDLEMSEVDEIVLRYRSRNVPREIVSPPPSVFITGPYYYNGPLDLDYFSNRDLKPNPYAKPISEEELLNWANH